MKSFSAALALMATVTLVSSVEVESHHISHENIPVYHDLYGRKCVGYACRHNYGYGRGGYGYGHGGYGYRHPGYGYGHGGYGGYGPGGYGHGGYGYGK